MKHLDFPAGQVNFQDPLGVGKVVDGQAGQNQPIDRILIRGGIHLLGTDGPERDGGQPLAFPPRGLELQSASADFLSDVTPLTQDSSGDAPDFLCLDLGADLKLNRAQHRTLLDLRRQFQGLELFIARA